MLKNKLIYRKPKYLYLGEWDLSKDVDCDEKQNGNKYCSESAIVAGVEEVIIHPEYMQKDIFNDIALLRMNISMIPTGKNNKIFETN